MKRHAAHSVTAALVSAALLFVPAVGQGPDFDLGTTYHQVEHASSTVGAFRYQGRFDMSDPTKPKFSWPGSRVNFTFTGTSVAVKLNAPGIRFRAAVDSTSTDFIATSAQTYTVATGLSGGGAVHKVSLWRQTEPSQGVSEFLGVSFPTGGALGTAPTAWVRRLEVIGDSISTGYGNEGAFGCVGYSVSTQNHWKSYEGLASRAKRAELVTLAWSGKGLYRNYDGTTAATGETMPELYLRTIPTDPTSVWGFTTDIPHVVLINLGTNDWNHGDPGSVFTSTYVSFIRAVRAHYPSAKIIVALTPMGSSTQRAQIKSRLLGIVSTMNTAYADANVSYLDLTSQGANRGCNSHPNLIHHETMSGIVQTALRAQVGW
ncbi:SGNH/GDSL hydrolase family protein [Microbacterium pumilum]|uniref:SGNH/GDSL hydrolase family protein n=1 Tax=Microbacterium pumilum TaxID=344165 RepID=A0ABN2T3W2_9MICO